ncbi:MAG: 6,7-dimethyl-8-ribityllumazine synthase [Parcubacteria group bacterium]|jgi:6,7-dimethyl-8-ribityllumazine synthase|nr:6,7-dimethyl-8-ribityllumazine synthase [Parcubacteria group bacterium]|tara:strand:+ start:4365 stop:4850 length:486 start_codon:yes stop_codon:yes gene_type:complete
MQIDKSKLSARGGSVFGGETFVALDYKVGLVASYFNEEITSALINSAKDALEKYQVAEKNIKLVKVAGCVEIPLMLQHLAKSKEYDCLVALGAVVRGETSHFDYVAKIVTEGILKVMLEHHLPIGFGVLTTDNLEQAKERVNTGSVATSAALHSAHLIKQN